jgi:mono/diheme cytochrome c family protein
MRRTVLPLAAATASICLLVLTLSPNVRADDAGATLFKKNCVLCHAADGSGSSPSGKALKAKDLGSSEVQKNTDEQITEILTKGKGKMPAFGAKLKPEDIKQLVAYVRTLAKK